MGGSGALSPCETSGSCPNMIPVDYWKSSSRNRLRGSGPENSLRHLALSCEIFDSRQSSISEMKGISSAHNLKISSMQADCGLLRAKTGVGAQKNMMQIAITKILSVINCLLHFAPCSWSSNLCLKPGEVQTKILIADDTEFFPVSSVPSHCVECDL